MFFSVLEQFEITKFSFFFFSIEKEQKIVLFFNKILLFIKNDILLMNVKFDALQRIIIKFFKTIQSFFLPNSFSTKNYMYSRIMSFCLKTYFKLFIKRKLFLFLRCNAQVIKFKIQYILQKAIESNFGHGYPYYSRLLNYYPYLFVTFFLIVCHNFNGLFFYGFTNTAFLLQNFVISFQAVVGLTLLAFL
jgi:hypothetical protein